MGHPKVTVFCVDILGCVPPPPLELFFLSLSLESEKSKRGGCSERQMREEDAILFPAAVYGADMHGDNVPLIH